MSCGNMGAVDSGLMPWLKVTAVAHVKVDTFQKVLQFCSPRINARSQRIWTERTHLQEGRGDRPTAAAPGLGPTWRRT